MMRETRSVGETMALAREIAESLTSGAVLFLEGPMGAGKTHFVKGLAEGLASPAVVTSPTFGLVHEYLGGRLPLYHFDMYRIEDPREMENLGFEEYFYDAGVSVIEWPERVLEYLPEDRLSLRVEVLSETQRRFVFAGSGSQSRQLLDELHRKGLVDHAGIGD